MEKKYAKWLLWHSHKSNKHANLPKGKNLPAGNSPNCLREVPPEMDPSTTSSHLRMFPRTVPRTHRPKGPLLVKEVPQGQWMMGYCQKFVSAYFVILPLADSGLGGHPFYGRKLHFMDTNQQFCHRAVPIIIIFSPHYPHSNATTFKRFMSTKDSSPTALKYHQNLNAIYNISTSTDKAFLLTSKFCPLGAVCPAPGLYTCIKSWKKLHKIRLQRHFFETCNKWMKWQDISVDIKTMSPGGCLPLPRAYIHV